jgi:cytochrome c oxidase cbb3-type subunit 3
MCSPCRRRNPLVWLLLGALALAGCEREDREYRGVPLPESGPATVPLSTLTPGAPSAPPGDPRGAQYEHNAYHIGQGQRLFRWFNCVGCHANGGGDIGPPLMDDQWRYGGDMQHIYASIAQGRPNGMPAFGGRIPQQQIWQLAAYVRSLSGNAPKDAVPSRNEGLSGPPPLTRLPKQPPRDSNRASGQEPQQ